MAAPRPGTAVVALLMCSLATTACTGQGAAGAPAPVDSASACPIPPPPGVSAEQAALCVYAGWVDTDADLVAAYGVEDVTSRLPTVMEDPRMRYDGCAPVDDATGDVLCTWTGVHVEGEPVLRVVASGDEAAGYRVTRIDVET